MSTLGDEIVRLHLAGVRSIDIAHRLNAAQSTVHYHIRKLHNPPPARKPRRSTRPRSASAQVSTREEISRLLSTGMTRIEIARTLGISKSTVSYHARRLGETIDGRFRRRYDWRAVQDFYDQGYSVRDCVRAFGFSTASWHEAVKRGLVTPRPAFRPAREVFLANTHRHRGRLKERLLRMGLKTNTCDHCGLTEWREKPITMALHHINGDRMDNRVENLELLCPNCHSQTDTFAGRNGRGLRAAVELAEPLPGEVTAQGDEGVSRPHEKDVDLAA